MFGSVSAAKNLQASQLNLQDSRDLVVQAVGFTYLQAIADEARVETSEAQVETAKAEFDAIFSTATFHWVLDHDALFRNLHESLRPGGMLVAQWGGGANLAAARDVLDPDPAAELVGGHAAERKPYARAGRRARAG